MLNKHIDIKKILFFMLTIMALNATKVQACGSVKSLVWAERDVMTFHTRLHNMRVHELPALREVEHRLEPYNQHLSKLICHNYKHHYPSLALLRKDIERKKPFFYRTMSTGPNLNLQLKEEEIINNFSPEGRKKQTLIIGGGQAGLAIAYFLRRHNLAYTILDSEERPGGAWQHGWDSLRLFSPAQWSSLPGWPMPPFNEGYPTKAHTINYLAEYEKRYQIPVERPVKIRTIRKEKGIFVAYTDKGEWESQTIVSATGKWRHPFIPDYPGKNIYRGKQIHSAFYQNPDAFNGQHVLIVGGGNSGAQILAEVSKIAKTTWVTLEEPLFLPDEVDGRVLFERATERWKALQEGRTIETPKGGLGDIVMVPSVKEARSRNVLTTVRPFKEFSEDGVVWHDGTHNHVDSVIWCTGFKSALNHLQDLGVVEADGKVAVNGTRSIKEPNLWLVGYGDWVGYASATLIGVTRTARETAIQIAATLNLLNKS